MLGLKLASESSVHMNGRIYDPSIGRMMSVDPIVAQPDNAQNWNRYSYVHNNPLGYTDPSGFASNPPGRGHHHMPEVVVTGMRTSFSTSLGNFNLSGIGRLNILYTGPLSNDSGGGTGSDGGSDKAPSAESQDEAEAENNESTDEDDADTNNVQNALDAIRNDNPDLTVPFSADDIGRLPTDDPALGSTDILSGDISISESYFDNDLSDGMGQNLVETLMHEVLHHNQSIFGRYLDSFTDHVDIYNEADRRLNDGREYDAFNRGRGL